MKTIKRILSALILSLPLTVVAENELYRVELLIFEQSSLSGDNEIWPAETDYPPLGNATDINPHQNLLPLPAEEAEFGRIIAALERSSIYQPLWHGIWLQPGWDSDMARTIRIDVKPEDKLPVEIDSATVKSSASQPNQPPAWVALGEQANNRDSLLVGTVTISRARYLHAALDLIYEEPGNQSDRSPDTGMSANSLWTVDTPVTLDRPTPIRMVQSRRMRSKELHYIDNPRLGALIKITPVEAPADPKAASDTAN